MELTWYLNGNCCIENNDCLIFLLLGKVDRIRCSI